MYPSLQEVDALLDKYEDAAHEAGSWNGNDEDEPYEVVAQRLDAARGAVLEAVRKLHAQAETHVNCR